MGRIPPSNIFAGRVLEKSIDGGALYVCTQCNLHFRWPQRPQAELAKLYQRGDAHAWDGISSQSREDWATAAKWLLQCLPDDARVLDIGCSTGRFLSDVLKWEGGKYGVEINAAAARIAQKSGVHMLGTDFYDITWNVTAGKRFSAVVAFDVIEHVQDPTSFLRSCKNLLAPGGRILISTGNTDAKSWFLSGSRYWYCSIPEHMSFINERWCRYAADELNLCFDRVHFFSHTSAGFGKRFREAAINSVSIMAPSVFHFLRRIGMGGVDVGRHPEMVDFPPNWMTAKDHLLAEFRIPS